MLGDGALREVKIINFRNKCLYLPMFCLYANMKGQCVMYTVKKYMHTLNIAVSVST